MGYDEAVSKTVITQIASISVCEIVVTHPKSAFAITLTGLSCSLSHLFIFKWMYELHFDITIGGQLVFSKIK